MLTFDIFSLDFFSFLLGLFLLILIFIILNLLNLWLFFLSLFLLFLLFLGLLVLDFFLLFFSHGQLDRVANELRVLLHNLLDLLFLDVLLLGGGDRERFGLREELRISIGAWLLSSDMQYPVNQKLKSTERSSYFEKTGK